MYGFMFGWFAGVALPIGVIVSMFVTFYFLTIGIGKSIDKQKEKGYSNLKVGLYSFAVWVPVIVTIFAIRRF